MPGFHGSVLLSGTRLRSWAQKGAPGSLPPMGRWELLLLWPLQVRLVGWGLVSLGDCSNQFQCVLWLQPLPPPFHLLLKGWRSLTAWKSHLQGLILSSHASGAPFGHPKQPPPLYGFVPGRDLQELPALWRTEGSLRHQGQAEAGRKEVGEQQTGADKAGAHRDWVQILLLPCKPGMNPRILTLGASIYPSVRWR